MDPEDMSGGTGWSGDYLDWTKQQLMLLWFWNKLQEAYDGGDSGLRLMIIRGGGETGVRAYVPVSDPENVNVHSQSVNVSDEIPELRRGGEAVAVFDRLWREGYIDVNFGRHGPYGDARLPVLHNLTTKGLIDIGKFPDPDRRLAAALAAARHVIEQEPSIPSDEKRDMLDTLESMASLANNVRGVAQAVIQGLSST